jgi:hypothetical protein
MRPDIGLMIAAYIVTQMVLLLGQPRPQAHPVAQVFAVITILVALVCALDLALRGVPGNIPTLR